MIAMIIIMYDNEFVNTQVITEKYFYVVQIDVLCQCGWGDKIVIAVDGGKWYVIILQRLMEESMRSDHRPPSTTHRTTTTPPPIAYLLLQVGKTPSISLPKRVHYGDIRDYILNGPSFISPSRNGKDSSDEVASDFSTFKPLFVHGEFFRFAIERLSINFNGKTKIHLLIIFLS